MKTFNQTVTDFQTLSNDASTGTQTLAKTLVNLANHRILGRGDWNFNKDSKDYTTVALQQEYDPPYNADKIEFVNFYAGSIWYAPKEMRSDDYWTILNRTTVYSDAPQFWHISTRTRKFGLYPIPSSAGNTIRVVFTKKIRDLSVADYTTGTVTTVANSITITGAGTTFTPRMVGSWIKITSTTTVLGDMWFEINGYTSATVITVRESVPVAVAGASFTISELIPFPDGFEDIPLWFALDKYYQMREKPTLGREYERMWKEALEELERRDVRSATGILEKQTPITPVDPNSDPYAINIIP